MAECKLCRLHEHAQTNKLKGTGPIPCDIMILGEAPGYVEDEKGAPFLGKAGKLLSELLAEAGLKREDVYLTNAVKCRPQDNSPPNQKEIKACSIHLKKEIAEVKPKYVIVLGATALKATLNKSGVMQLRGQTVERDGISYMITMHPAGLFRQPQQESSVRADFKRFGDVIRGTLHDLNSELNWTLVDTPGKLRQCMASLAQADVIVYDVETSSLNMLDPQSKIYCLGLAQPGKQWVIPLWYPTSPFNDELTQSKIFKMLELAVRGKKWVAHNAKFDSKWLLAKHGFHKEHTFDTMLASHLLDENNRHGLKPLSQMYFNAPEYELPMPIDPYAMPLHKLARYCAIDVFYTLKLYMRFKEELLRDKQLTKIFKHITIPASNGLVKSELEGIYLDSEKYQAALSTVNSRIKDLLTALDSYAPGINWNSTQQVAMVLFDKLGLESIAKTDTGKDSTAESVLLQLRNHPVVETLLKYREQKKLSEFLISWGKLMKNDRIHPNFKIHGTVTGRLSCVDPNLQQVPRDPFLRSIITAPPGWVFVEADYSQIELRIAAAISGDVTMKRAFQTRGDVHRLTASAVSGIPPEQVTNDMRKKAKAVNFGFLYGMGAKKFKEYARDKYDVHLKDAEAIAFRERFFDLYSGLPSWHDRQRRLVKKFGYVRNPIGRKRRLPEINSPENGIRAEAERQAINAPVQGFGADLAMFAYGRILKELPWAKIRCLGNIHDALLFIIRKDSIDEMLLKVREYMTDMETIEAIFGYKIPVPIEIEIKLGSWGSGKIWDTGNS